jgi:hypothetical protein
MANKYTTKINSIFCVQSPEPDYVVNCLFTVSGDDGQGHTASIDGNVMFSTEQEAEFIPYDELTDVIVMDWINEATDNLANYYANIDDQIQSQVTPPVSPTAQPLPWATLAAPKM